MTELNKCQALLDGTLAVVGDDHPAVQDAMAALHNSWQVFDTTEPVLVWQARLPLPASSSPSALSPSALSPSALSPSALSSALLAALSPLVTRTGALDSLDDEHLDKITVHRSLVTVRDEHDGLVDVTASDAGELLRRLEGPAFEALYARRFAALGQPFVSVVVSTAGNELTLTVSFFATIWFDDRDADLRARNEARLLAARTELTSVVRQHGGQLNAPLAPR